MSARRTWLRGLLVFFFLLVVAVLQTTLGPLLGVLGVAPDGVLVLVVCWALVRGSEEGMIWGMLGGLCVGLLSGAPLGTHALVLTLIGWGAGVGQRSPLISRLLVPLVVISTATIAYTTGVALILRATGWQLGVEAAVARVVVPAVITNGGMAVAIRAG